MPCAVTMIEDQIFDQWQTYVNRKPIWKTNVKHTEALSGLYHNVSKDLHGELGISIKIILQTHIKINVVGDEGVVWFISSRI